ncbi:MAG: ROK family protein [Nocardioidaceae bacterium]|nr:ROK family protein [Nocardioidaceae bacterium]
MRRRAGIAQDELRRVNLAALLSRVHVRGATSRAVLTAELGLNRSTIGDLVGHLESLGLVTESSSAAGGRSGRPSLTVTPRCDVAVLAIALEVDRIIAAVVGLGGVELARGARPHQRGEHDVEHVIESVAQLAHQVLEAAEVATCLGAGVSVPGAVRAADGMVRFAPNLGWNNEPFAGRLSERLALPVAVGNDANLGALAEHLRGAAVGVDDVAYVTGSVGIGGGFLTAGAELHGFEGYAGEVGHLLVDSNGDECRCGAFGCWETKVGENHLLTGAGRLPGGGPEAVAEVIEAATAGDGKASASLDAVATWTGVGLRNIVNLFNPEMIVLGGVLARAWTARPGLVDAGMARGALIAPRESVTLRVAALGEDSPLLGAAELAFAPLVADPLLLERGVLPAAR